MKMKLQDWIIKKIFIPTKHIEGDSDLPQLYFVLTGCDFSNDTLLSLSV